MGLAFRGGGPPIDHDLNEASMSVTSRQRTVGHLQNLYTVTVGVALALAIGEIIDRQAAVPVRYDGIPYFVAYLVTLVPFCHGALRHLDITYFEDPASQSPPLALMVDWGLLFIESCALLALALLIKEPVHFMFGFAAILAFDALWALYAHVSSAGRRGPEGRWAMINFVAVIALVVLIIFLDSRGPGMTAYPSLDGCCLS